MELASADFKLLPPLLLWFKLELWFKLNEGEGAPGVWCRRGVWVGFGLTVGLGVVVGVEGKEYLGRSLVRGVGGEGEEGRKEGEEEEGEKELGTEGAEGVGRVWVAKTNGTRRERTSQLLSFSRRCKERRRVSICAYRQSRPHRSS